MDNIKNWKEFLNSVPTEELRREIERRETNNIFTVLSFIGYEGSNYDRQPVHIIEGEDGSRQKAELRDVADKHLAELQPKISDDDDGWDEAWEEYEDYQSKYLIGKKIKKEKFGYSIV